MFLKASVMKSAIFFRNKGKVKAFLCKNNCVVSTNTLIFYIFQYDAEYGAK